MALWSWQRVSHKILNLQDRRVFVDQRKQKPYRCFYYTLSRGYYKLCVHTSVCTGVRERERRTHAPGPRHVHVTVSCWEGERKRYWENTHNAFEVAFLQIPELPAWWESMCPHDVNWKTWWCVFFKNISIGEGVWWRIVTRAAYCKQWN